MIKETNTLNQVADFHKLFELPILDSPRLPDSDRCQLRVDLLKEELGELVEAIENKDLVEVADALADIQYILSGTVLEFGMQDIFKKLNDEVHRSNMSKACSSLSEAELTAEKYAQKGVNETYVSESGDFLLVKRKDGKVLKSAHYSPAQLSPIIVEGINKKEDNEEA